jgi:hypothetical protein
VPNPYEPRGWPRTNVESRSPLEQFVARLRDLGATDDEVELVETTWDNLDPDDSSFPEAWTRARRDEMARLGDNELRRMIRDSREEYALGTTTEEEQQAAEDRRRAHTARAEASERIHGNVPSVLAWVGDDTVRARAVLELETGVDGRERSTLVKALREIVNG